ncbi:MAG: ABC-2 transporter permease [Spirochaetales bacterium]|nr:ABC-2 transporter permease [Spirochaetales bacterium]
MRSLIYKDFKLSINWFFFIIMPFLTGALFLIPQWPFFIALMYFFFITVPNVFATYNSQNDFGFAIMMPVSKNDIVKGKISSFIIIELIHLLTGAIFAFIHVKLYGIDNFMLDLNFAFFGIAFMMFALFNIVFFPIYFKSAYKYGIPTIAANVAAILFAAAVELLVLFNPVFRNFLEGRSPEMKVLQIIILIAGIGIFALFNFIAYKMSAKRFENIDL